MNLNEQHIIDELKKGTTPLPSDDYFAQLKNDLLRKTETPKIVPIYRRMWFITAAAASVVLIVTLFVLNSQEASPNQVAGKVNWESVSREDVLAYIQDNIEEFETDAIVEHLDSIPDWKNTITTTPEDSLSVADRNSSDDDYDDLFRDIDKDDILKYLQEEAVDMDDEMLLGS